MSDDELQCCPTCGAYPAVVYGADIRFPQSASGMRMWRSECPDGCVSFTRFTRENAVESWKNATESHARNHREPA